MAGRGSNRTKADGPAFEHVALHAAYLIRVMGAACPHEQLGCGKLKLSSHVTQ